MQLLDLTLDDPPNNLALDEALLEHADGLGGTESNPGAPEVLRLWEPAAPMVVLGRSSPMEREVNLDFCREHGVPVLRRCSGGATIVTGPGCLMYALQLNFCGREDLRMLDIAHRFVMNQMRQAIGRLNVAVEIQGTSDLTLAGRKFSGNSLRCKKNAFVYHGTIICDFDLSWVTRCLGIPERQPDYRDGRNHADFLTQLPVGTLELRSAIAEQWQALTPMETWPLTLTATLANEKYRCADWTAKVP